MDVYSAATLIPSITSSLFTVFAAFVCVTQKNWKKRDGVLLFNTFVIDVMFSCCGVFLHIQTDGEHFFAIVYVFLFLLSWANQALITTNRYVVISFPFGYKTMLGKTRLLCLVVSIWFLICTFIILTCVFSESYADKDDYLTFFELFLPRIPYGTIIAILTVHGILLLVVYVFEFSLWRTAKGHQSRYRSIAHAVKAKEQKLDNIPRKLSITQHFQRRFSLQTTQGMSVKRTPIVLLGIHLLSIIPYCIISIMFVVRHDVLFDDSYFRSLSLTSQMVISFRPIINAFNHLSKNNMRKFKTYMLRKFTKSRDMRTDYYIENQKEVEKLKLRRESSHSVVTEVSVV